MSQRHGLSTHPCGKGYDHHRQQLQNLHAAFEQASLANETSAAAATIITQWQQAQSQIDKFM